MQTQRPELVGGDMGLMNSRNLLYRRLQYHRPLMKMFIPLLPAGERAFDYSLIPVRQIPKCSLYTVIHWNQYHMGSYCSFTTYPISHSQVITSGSFLWEYQSVGRLTSGRC